MYSVSKFLADWGALEDEAGERRMADEVLIRSAVYEGIEKRVKTKTGDQELFHPVEFDDVALPVEFHRNGGPFPCPVQRRFAKVCRVGLFPLRGPEPDAGSIRIGKFQRTRDETPDRSGIDGSGEIRHDVVVMHTNGQDLSDLGIFNPDLGVDVDDADGSPKENEIGLQF